MYFHLGMTPVALLLWANAVGHAAVSATDYNAYSADRETSFAATQPAQLQLPEVKLTELQAGSSAASIAARTALTELGAVTVVGGEDFSKALEAWAGCLLPGGSLRQTSRAVTRPLANGFVRRTTVAAQGRWGSDSDLPDLAACPEAAEQGKAMRLGVRSATKALFSALGSLGSNAGAARKVPFTTVPGQEEPVSLQLGLDRAEHLEHLHVYEEAHSGSGMHAAIEPHTDSGLMLAFVPPVFAEGQGTLPGVEIETKDGTRHSLARLSPGSVVFLVGEAARLITGASQAGPLRALPHAVSLPEGFRWRAWYGAMLLLPRNALVHLDRSDLSRAVSFGELWQTARVRVSESAAMSNSDDSASIGCGAGLRFADQAGGCKNNTEVYCWLQCMPLKGFDTCTGGHWTSAGVGDIAKWSRLEVACREPASGKKWPTETGSMCSGCKLACTLTNDAPAPAPGPPMQESDFCMRMSDGKGLAMYMAGFQWTSRQPDIGCLSLYFSTWLLDEQWKFAVACAGVICLGIAMEMVSLGRRRLPSQRQLDVGFFFHLVNLVLAYFVMLAIMTYSLELFLCAISGLLLGHILSVFISRHLKQQSSSPETSSMLAPGTEVGSPCCRIAHGSFREDTQLTLPRQRHRKANGHVASGTEVRLKLEGMTCGSCVATVTRALEAVDGVVKVQVSLEKSSALVGYCPPADVSAICEATDDVGFRATVDQAQPSTAAPHSGAAAPLLSADGLQPPPPPTGTLEYPPVESNPSSICVEESPPQA